MKAFATALFDLEGTLVGYDETFELRWTQKLLRDFGRRRNDPQLAGITDDDVAAYLQLPVRDRVSRLLAWGYRDAEEFLAGWSTDDACSAKLGGMFCYPDASVLRDCAERGVKVGVVTSSPERIARAQVRLLEDRVGAVISSVTVASRDSGVPMKPHPDPLLRCLAELDAGAESAFYVGNEDVDVRAAVASGIYDVLIDRGRTRTTVQPSLRITSLRALVPFLKDAS